MTRRELAAGLRKQGCTNIKVGLLSVTATTPMGAVLRVRPGWVGKLEAASVQLLFVLAGILAERLS